MLFLGYIKLYFSIEKLIFLESRLNHAQRETYLKRLLEEYDEESKFEDDDEDEDWLPSEVVEEPPSDSGTSSETSKAEGESNAETDEIKIESEAAGTPAADEAGIETENAYITKDKTFWTHTPLQVHLTPHNVLRQRSGPNRSTETLSVGDTFKRIYS